jgi:hypothetical protein
MPNDSTIRPLVLPRRSANPPAAPHWPSQLSSPPSNRSSRASTRFLTTSSGRKPPGNTDHSVSCRASRTQRSVRPCPNRRSALTRRAPNDATELRRRQRLRRDRPSGTTVHSATRPVAWSNRLLLDLSSIPGDVTGRWRGSVRRPKSPSAHSVSGVHAGVQGRYRSTASDPRRVTRAGWRRDA